jgi:ubiquitin C-terminal hydrolase
MYKKEYSGFLSMFYGIHVSQIKSLESDYENITPEPFFNITLPMTKSNNLLASFEEYVKVEKMEGDNRILNDKTNNKEVAQKQIKFWSLPDVLVVTLKRFDNRNRKNQAVVDFPLEGLDLSKYIIGYDKSSYVYNLYGICNHSGGSQGGHYTAFIRNSNKKWYHFNDTMVNEVTNLAKLKGPQAYCFFYRKQK